MKLHVSHLANADSGGSRKEPARSTASPRTAALDPTDLPPSPSTECSQKSTVTTDSPNDELLRRLASSNYKSYTAALTVTIAVGCFLLLLNVLIFAGIYHQSGSRSRSLKDNMAETRSSSSSDNYDKNLDYELRAFEEKAISFKFKSTHLSRGSGSKFDLQTSSDCGAPTFGEYNSYDNKQRAAQRSLPDVSVGSAIDAGSDLCINNERPDIQNVDEGKQDSLGRSSTFEQRVINSATQVKYEPGGAKVTEVPYKDASDSCDTASGLGIMGVQPSVTVFTSTLPGIMKKRVQIQEISV